MAYRGFNVYLPQKEEVVIGGSGIGPTGPAGPSRLGFIHYNENLTFGGPTSIGVTAGHKVSVTATKTANYCEVSITLSRSGGVHFNTPTVSAPGTQALATLPDGYRPIVNTHAIGESSHDNAWAGNSLTWGGYQVNADGKVYQRGNAVVAITDIQPNYEILRGTVCYTLDGSSLHTEENESASNGSTTVTSVQAKTGVVTLTPSDLGLGSIDNTSDLDKPISLATQGALDGKLNASSKGIANGIASLGIDGKVLPGELPSFVTAVAGKIGIVNLIKNDVGLEEVDNTSDVSKPVSTATQTALDLKMNLSEKGIANGVASLGSDGKVPSSQLPVTSTSVASVAGKTGVVLLEKVDVGLENVDNTTDLLKPVSSATQTALDLKVDLSSKGVANGVASLGATGKVPTSQLESISTGNTFVVANQSEQLGLLASVGDVSIRTDTQLTYILQTAPPTVFANWVQLLTPLNVSSVAGKTGNVSLVKNDVGLEEVDNTSDVNKPVSTAIQTALDLKINASEKGVTNGIASLGSDGKVPSDQLPVTSTAVSSVAGKTGVILLDKTDVGLSNVDNTTDLLKPISTATQTALNLKQNTITGAASTVVSADLPASVMMCTNNFGKIGSLANVSTTQASIVLLSSTPDSGLVITDTQKFVHNEGTYMTHTAFTSVWNWIVSKMTGAVSSILTGNLTASRALVSDTAGKVAVSSVTSAQLESLITLGTQLTQQAIDTLTVDVAETTVSVVITPGKWIVFGGATVNQTAVENSTDYIAGIITDAPGTFTSQFTIVGNNNGALARFSGGADAGLSLTPRYYTVAVNTTISLRLITSFTTETNTVLSTITAVKVGI